MGQKFRRRTDEKDDAGKESGDEVVPGIGVHRGGRRDALYGMITKLSRRIVEGDQTPGGGSKGRPERPRRDPLHGMVTGLGRPSRAPASDQANAEPEADAFAAGIARIDANIARIDRYIAESDKISKRVDEWLNRRLRQG